jgi:hypothetical protein
MPSLDEKRVAQPQQILKAGTISFDGSGIDCLVRKMSSNGANLEVESQIGIPNSFDWLSIQSTAIIIVALSGESASDRYRVRLEKAAYRVALHWRGTEAPRPRNI